MDAMEFEHLMLSILLPTLIIAMGFIVWDIARRSKAGRFGTWILFGTLGLGVLGFVIKELIALSLKV
ncbi:MAG: DUF2788 domain-containing protein [Kistimonas sp.]|nr:DUF2788 domain-containing protein [Kistimonas sp.]